MEGTLMDDDLYAEMDAVAGCRSEGFDDGWNSRDRNPRPYDREAYDQGYKEGADAARRAWSHNVY